MSFAAIAAVVLFAQAFFPTPEQKIFISNDWSVEQAELLRDVRDRAYPLLEVYFGSPIDRDVYTVRRADGRGCVPRNGSMCLEDGQWGATFDAPEKLILLRAPEDIPSEYAIDFRRGFIHELGHTFRGDRINDNIFVEEGLCEWAADEAARTLGIPNIRPIVNWELIKNEPIPWANYREELDPNLLVYRLAAAFWTWYLNGNRSALPRLHQQLLGHREGRVRDDDLRNMLVRVDPWTIWDQFFVPRSDPDLVVVYGEDECGKEGLWLMVTDGKSYKPVRGLVTYSFPDDRPSFCEPVFSETEGPHEVRYSEPLASGTKLEVKISVPGRKNASRTIVVP